MGTNSMKHQLAALRAEWAKAPMTARMMAGAYISPLLDLLEAMIHRLEGAERGHQVPGLALESGEFVPANQLQGGHHGDKA